MVGDVPGQVGQRLLALKLFKEVDLAAGDDVQSEDRAVLLALGEPGDLVVEVLGARLVEDGVWQAGQLRRGGEAGGGEGLEQRVAGTVDVEVAEGNQPAGHLAMASSSGTRSTAFAP